MTLAESPIWGGRSVFASWLERLVAVARPLLGRPGGRVGASPPVDPQADAALRHAQKLALAGRLAAGLVHDLNNALLVAVASLDMIGEAPDQPNVVKEQAQAAAEALRRASGL